ncbi:MAG: hypothetical protein KC800_22105, partial [Candidatus Eremiobacteraeota bacterium]|nr:hypothetical protein [Candidatus Eremiobacteraeota bacterium]
MAVSKSTSTTTSSGYRPTRESEDKKKSDAPQTEKPATPPKAEAPAASTTDKPATEGSEPTTASPSEPVAKQASYDEFKPSLEATEKDDKTEEEEDHFQTHLDALERNFANVDDKGGDDEDGTISDGDIEAVAKGDYDEDKVRERLEDRGLSGQELEDEVDALESAAKYFDENESEFAKLEGAGDGGDTDGKLSFKDIDNLQIDKLKNANDEKQAALERGELPDLPSDDELRAAAEKFSDASSIDKALSKDGNLSNYSNAELLTLAGRGQDDPKIQAAVSSALEDTITNAESLDQLNGSGFRQLIGQNVLGAEGEVLNESSAQKLDELTEQKVQSVLDGTLSGRRGDAAAENAGDRVSEELRGLALDNLAVAGYIEKHVGEKTGDLGDKIQDIQRADDNIFQKAGNFLKDAGSVVGDGIRKTVDLATKLPSPLTIAGKVYGTAVRAGGDLAAAGLDALGAEGAADFVDRGSELVGNGVEKGTQFIETQSDNFVNGAGEGAAGAVEGITSTIADPLATVKGFAEIAKDPTLLVEGYKETAGKHGIAGALGHVAFDVFGTKGIGSGLTKLKSTTAAAKLADNLGPLGFNQTAKFLDNTSAKVRGLESFQNARNAIGNAKVTARVEAGRRLGDGLENLGGRTGIGRLSSKGDELQRGSELLSERRRISREYGETGGNFELVDGTEGFGEQIFKQGENGTWQTSRERFKEHLDKLDQIDPALADDLAAGLDGNVVGTSRAAAFDELTKDLSNPRDIARKFRHLASDAGPGGAAIVELTGDARFSRASTSTGGLNRGSTLANLSDDVAGLDSRALGR